MTELQCKHDREEILEVKASIQDCLFKRKNDQLKSFQTKTAEDQIMVCV